MKTTAIKCKSTSPHRAVMASLFIGMIAASSFAAGERINHIPAARAAVGTAVNLEAFVEGGTNLPIGGRIHYRILGEAAFLNAEMIVDQRRLSGTIPQSAVIEPELEYYLEVDFDGGAKLTFPIGAPINAEPLHIPVAPSPRPVTAVARGVGILSPSPGTLVDGAQAVIAVALPTGEGGVVADSVRVFLDGVDVTQLGWRTDELVSIPIEKLPPGAHWVEVVEITPHGSSRLAAWQFSSLSAGRLSFKLPVRARVTAGYSGEDISQQKRDIIYLDGRLWGQQGKLDWFLRSYITSLEKPDTQPQNRFLAALKYRSLTLRAGDPAPEFSEFSLWGVRTRGVEFQMDSPILKLGVVWGYLRRGIEGMDIDTSDAVDRPGTYARKVLAVRPGIPISRWVTLSFNMVKVKDDVGSIKWGAQPKDNLVVGTDLRVESASRRFLFTTETAVSLYNSDISSGPMADAKDLESVIIVNQFFDPLPADSSILKSDVTASELAKTLLGEIGKSSLAHRTMLTVNFYRNELRLGYKTIGRSFRSLGSPTILNDVAGFSVQDRIRLFNFRIYLTLGYESYADNVNSRAPTTTDRTITRASLAYYSPPQYPNLNFGVRMYDRTNDGGVTVRYLSNGDSIYVDNRVENLASTYNFGIDQTFAFGGMLHTAALFYNKSVSDDAVNSSLNADFGSFNLFLNSRLEQLLETTLAFSSSEQRSLDGREHNTFATTSASARWTLQPQRLWVSAGVSLTGAEGGNDELGALYDSTDAGRDETVKLSRLELSRLEFSVGLDYNFRERHLFNLSAYRSNQQDDGYIEYYSGRREMNSANSDVRKQNDMAVRLKYTYSL